MAMRFVTSLKSTLAAALISAAGSAAKGEFWNGTVPAVGAAPAGTKLADVTFGSAIGTQTSGVIDIDEAGITNSAGSNVAGTPTFFRLKTSGGTTLADFDIGAGAGNMQFSGAIATGTAISFSGCTITIGN